MFKESILLKTVVIIIYLLLSAFEPKTSKYAIYTQKELLNSFYCAFYKDILHFLNPNTTLQNKMNIWTKWRIFTWYPGVRLCHHICKWLWLIFSTHPQADKQTQIFLIVHGYPWKQIENGGKKTSPLYFSHTFHWFDIHWTDEDALSKKSSLQLVPIPSLPRFYNNFKSATWEEIKPWYWIWD